MEQGLRVWVLHSHTPSLARRALRDMRRALVPCGEARAGAEELLCSQGPEATHS